MHNLAAAMQPSSTGGAYVNVVGNTEPQMVDTTTFSGYADTQTAVYSP